MTFLHDLTPAQRDDELRTNAHLAYMFTGDTQRRAFSRLEDIEAFALRTRDARLTRHIKLYARVLSSRV